MEALIGREMELGLLHAIAARKTSSFVALYGRRRVGKTFLIRKAFPLPDFHVTGMANTNTATQLRNFQIALKKYSSPETKQTATPNWLEAFNQLRILLESKGKKKKIIFLD